MRRMMALALLAVMLLTLTPALAEKPRLTAEPGVLYLHPGETGTVKLALKNGQTGAAPTLKSDDGAIARGAGVSGSGRSWTLSIKAGEDSGMFTHVTASLVLDDGKKLSRTLNVHVADNFAPRIKWYHILTDSSSGYPQLKLSMTDDFGLEDVCIVRRWTDEAGDELTEIYDVLSLSGTEAVRFRTLSKPGAYSVQINDNGTPAARFNSDILLTLTDVDHNGVSDAYYTDDENVLVMLNVNNETLPPLSREINPN